MIDPDEKKTVPSEDRQANERHDTDDANLEMDKEFKQGNDEPPPHSDKVGGLRGNPS